jgi:hypothetical protein
MTSLAVIAAIAIAGCGSGASHSSASGSELALQRAQFAQLSDQLHSAEGEVQHEVAASRVAWPLIATGLPPVPSASLQHAVSAASAGATALREPRFMTSASRLTGPAAGIAGLYESYERLAERGWRLTDAAISSIVGGTATVADFERQNSSLYIDAIYDAHFDLSLLGKDLTSGYEKLGGSSAFGTALTQSELSALAAAFSIPTVRLEPHPAGAAKEG